MKRCYGIDDEKAALADLFDEQAGEDRDRKADRSSPTIHPRLFERLVRQCERGPSCALIVAGRTCWSDLRCEHELVFRGIRFESDFVARVAEFTSLSFENCVFLGDVELCNSRIRGNLALTGCAIGRGRSRASLDLDGAKVSGHVEIENSRIAGGLVADSVGCLALRLVGSHIGVDCAMVGLVAHRHVVLHATQISGRLMARFLRCEGLVRLEHGCHIGGELDFAGAHVKSQLDLADGAFGEIRFNGSTVGSMWIGSSGKVQCRGIYAIGSRFTSYVRMSRLAVRVPAKARASAPLADEWGKIFFGHCQFGSQVCAWVWHRDRPDGGWERDNCVSVDKSVSIVDCDITGELDLTRLKVGGGGRNASGIVRLDRTKLRGWLFLSSPTAVARRLGVPSEVRVNARAQVERGRTMAPRFRARMRSLSLRDVQASGADLSGLELVRCRLKDTDADVDGSLSGDRLHVTGTFTTYARLDTAADAAAAAGGCHRSHAVIPGALRLRGARIGELRLAGDSLSKPEEGRASTSGVVLELAKIGLLRVPQLDKDEERRLNGFPVPLDLSGMTVENWNFDENVDADTHAEVDKYLDFLDNDESLHREVYKSVAQSLRNAGRDRDAEKILYAEEYRARWETRQARSRRRNKPAWPELSRMGRAKGRRGGRAKSFRRLFAWLNRFIEWLDRVFLQYRRNPIALLYAILALFAFSTTLVASHAANFEPSERSRLILQNGQGAGAVFARGIEVASIDGQIAAHPDHWGFWKSLWMAAHYHVPIIALAAGDEYVATDDSPLMIGFPNDRLPLKGRFPFATAEDWFAVMTILNWVMWPLLLTFALRRALRSD